MSEKIVQLNEPVIKSELKGLVRGSVEETFNELLMSAMNSARTTVAAATTVIYHHFRGCHLEGAQPQGDLF